MLLTFPPESGPEKVLRIGPVSGDLITAIWASYLSISEIGTLFGHHKEHSQEYPSTLNLLEGSRMGLFVP